MAKKNGTRIAFFLALAAAAMLAGGCRNVVNGSSAGKISPAVTAVIPDKPDLSKDFSAWRAYMDENAVTEETVAAVRDFSWKTAAELLAGTEKNENYSPLSLYYALSLAASGAEGETKEEFLSLLGAEDVETLASECRKLYSSLYTDGAGKEGNKSRLTIANSLWMQEKAAFEDSFLKTASEDFFASLYTVDFSKPETAAAMSGWVKENTGGLLAPQMEADPEQILSIIDTVCFYDEWTDRFQKKKTAEDMFYLSGDEDGPAVEREFMNRGASGGFSVGENFTRASLSLKQNGEMVFVLPDPGVSVEELLADEEALGEAFSGGSAEYGTITWKVPKFSFGQKYDLKEALTHLGLTAAFEDTADFSAMTKESVWISGIRQETHIGIDENGVEAAAYTEIVYSGAGMPKDHADMILNRPFLYALTSRDGIPLFIGVYRGTE